MNIDKNIIYHQTLAAKVINDTTTFIANITSFGTENIIDKAIKKRIVLTNQLSLLMLFFVSLSAIIFAHFNNNVILIAIVASINIVPIGSLLLNKYHKTNSSRLLLGIFTPLMVMFSIIGIKAIGINYNFEINEYHYFTPRYYLVSMCLLPIFLIDIREHKTLIAAIIVNALIVALFDFAHQVANVSHERFGFTFNNYYQATLMPVILLFFLYGVIIFYQFESRKHEETIQQMYEAEQIRNIQVNEEIQLAKIVIDGLLPKANPTIQNAEIAVFMQWCKEVGGDYYTVKKIDASKFLIVVADVSGKGLAASIIVSTIHSCIETQLNIQNFNIKSFVIRLNEVLCSVTEQMNYATLWAAIYNEKTGELESVNCGHPAPIIINSNFETIPLKQGSTILGMFDHHFNVVSEKHTLHNRNQLLIFTDGITEASYQDNLYGEQKDLSAFLKNSFYKNADEILNSLISDVKKFSNKSHFEDDITCMVLTFNNTTLSSKNHSSTEPYSFLEAQ